jgi:hypothetical protein
MAWVYLQLLFLGLPSSIKFWGKKEGSAALFSPAVEKKVRAMLENTYKELGPVTEHECAVGICFCVAVVSWILHDPKFITGWGDLFIPGTTTSRKYSSFIVN